MGIDLVLNWLMPTLIILFFIGIFYVKLKEPADQFFCWIGRGLGRLITGGKERATESIVMGSEIVFE